MPRIKKDCYWCGKTADSKTYIPPQNIYPHNKRVALVTVPACEEHHEAFTHLDERMRRYIQGACISAFSFADTDVKAASGTEDSKAAGLAKKLFQGIRKIASPKRLTLGATFERDDDKVYFEKIARGLHYKHFKSQIDGEFTFAIKQSFFTTQKMLEYFQRLAPHFHDRTVVKVPRASYPEIFQYRYIKGKQRETSMFAVAMRFYSDYEAIGIFTSNNA